jgi:hypothetical protein
MPKKLKLTPLEKYHRSRRMFAVVMGTVLVAPEGCLQGHREWLMLVCGWQLGWAAYNEQPRGNVKDGLLMMYGGGDDHHDDVHKADVRAALNVLGKMYEIEEVGLGAVVGSPGEVWPPRRRYTVEEYLKRKGR